MAKKKASCVFCAIANGEDEKTIPLYKDEEFVVFKDIKPAAPHHYLVCPVKHIKDAKALKAVHLEMVMRMVEIGNQVLTEKGGDVSQARLGFHWPPFTLVSHVHLHVMAPQSEMGFMSRTIFRPGSLWFVTADWMIDRLKKLPNELSDQSTVVSTAPKVDCT